MADIAFVSSVRLDMNGQVQPNTLSFGIWCLTQCALGMLQILTNIIDDPSITPHTT